MLTYEERAALVAYNGELVTHTPDGALQALLGRPDTATGCGRDSCGHPLSQHAETYFRTHTPLQGRKCQTCNCMVYVPPGETRPE